MIEVENTTIEVGFEDLTIRELCKIKEFYIDGDKKKVIIKVD